jgi:energy-converting hydrogenase A subunit R
MEFDGLDEMMPYDGKVFISECEEAISLNSSALEACVKFIPDGYRFFKVLSSYDEVLSDVVRKEGHRPGDRIKFVLPFLKAYGVSDQALIDHFKENLHLMPGSDKTMRFVQEIMSPFIVSPAYEHHLTAMCEQVGFPIDNAFCTKFSLDSVKIDDWESQTLKDLTSEIAAMSPIDHSLGNRLKDLRPEDRKTIQRLDQIFWNEMTDLSSYHLVMETVTIGDSEKASAVVEICKRMGVALEDCIYIGGSISDAKIMSIVRKGGGLAVSFNGSSQAVKEADIAVMSKNTIITSMLADAFYRTGKEAVLDLADTWGYESMIKSGLVHEYILREVRRVFGESLPVIQRVTDDKVTELALRSSKFRRLAIDEGIGNIG